MPTAFRAFPTPDRSVRLSSRAGPVDVDRRSNPGACKLVEGRALSRIGLAFKAFWKILTDPAIADRVAPALGPPSAGPDLRILAVLQRDGRLVDFLQEEIDAYPDAQIGAAVRDIHRDCRKALRHYLTLQPVLAQAEGDPVTLAADFDPALIRLTGNVGGSPPFRGVLKHHGWRVTAVHLPTIPGSKKDEAVLAQAEVEIP